MLHATSNGTSSHIIWVVLRISGTCSHSIWIVQACALLLCREFVTFASAKRDFDGRESFQSGDTSSRVSGFSLNRGKPNIRSESFLTHSLLLESRNANGIRRRRSSSCETAR